MPDIEEALKELKLRYEGSEGYQCGTYCLKKDEHDSESSHLDENTDVVYFKGSDHYIKAGVCVECLKELMEEL